MTKNEAKKVARNARKFGHFFNDETQTLYLFCPRCKKRVETVYDRNKTKARVLDAMMVEHLVEDCDGK